MTSSRKLVAALLLPALGASAASAQFQVSTGNARASAECLIADPEQLLYGYNDDEQPEFYPSLELTRPLTKILRAGGTVEALGTLVLNFPTPRRLVVSGSTRSSVDPGPTGEEAFAEGSADFEVRFSLPSGGSFLIQAAALTASNGLSTLSVGTADFNLFAFDSDSAEDPSGVAGDLPPGEYIVYVSALSSTDLSFSPELHASAAFTLDFRLTPSCLGDLNNDGGVDLGDFFEFFNCFDADAGCADIDGVEGVDLGDYFAFLGSFDGGC
jgi:hypothetical protein